MITRKALVPCLLVLFVLASTTCASAQSARAAKQVIFRDDDVAPALHIDALKAINQVHVDENVPVTLAIVPKDSKTTDNLLHSDSKFFDYMSSIVANPLFEFAQHGVTHTKANLTLAGSRNSSEFEGEPLEVQYDAIKQGRDAIRATFGVTPTTFIPPWDHADLTTLVALRALGFTEYCTGPSEFPVLQGRIDGIRVEKAIVDLDISGSYAALNKSVQMAKNTTDQFMNDPNNDTLIIAYHWWAFKASDGSVDTQKVQLLHELINYVKTKEGVQFTRLDRQATTTAEAVPGATSSLTNVNRALTPYQLWLEGGLGAAYVLGFAGFVVSGRGGRK
jgi:hypothetical protein